MLERMVSVHTRSQKDGAEKFTNSSNKDCLRYLHKQGQDQNTKG